MRALAAYRRGVTAERRGALGIMAGTGSGQIVTLLVAPVVARLYGPASFGVLTIITALAMMLAAFASLRLDLAVPLPRADSTAFRLLLMGMTSSAVICTLAFIAVVVLEKVFHVTTAGGAQPWLWVFPLAALSISASQLLTQLAIRMQRYELVAQQGIIRTLTTLVAQLSLGVFSGPVGLLTGFTAGAVSAAAFIWARLRPRSIRADPAESYGEILRRYRNFPAHLAPAGLLNAAGLQAPLLLIATNYGIVVVGILGLVQRLLSLPGAVIGQAIAQVYLGQISHFRRTESAGTYQLFVKTTRNLLLMAIAGVLIVMVLSHRLGSVLGSDWSASGAYARAVVIGVAAQLVVSPVSLTLVVLQQTRLQFVWDAMRFIIVVGTIQVCVALRLTPLSCVWAYSVAATVMYALLWILTHRALRALVRTEPNLQ